MSDYDVPQRLVDLAAQVRGPRLLSDARLRERFGDPAEVEIEVGQVWRARWNEAVVLVLVLADDGRDVRAAPVTIDPPAEDDRCVVVTGSKTAFGVDATVWAGLTSAVPIRVLERLVDAWDDDLVHGVVDAEQGRLGRVPPGTRQGRRIRSELDPAALLRAELTDVVEALNRAPGMPVFVPGTPQRDLASLLGDRLDLAALCASLGLRQPDVMRLLRGKSPLAPDQIDVVARVTGLLAEEVAGTVRPLPLGLVVRMEHPRWRTTWVQRAQHLGVSEARARLDGSYGAYALAARETGGGEPDWDERLRRFLREEDAAAGGA